MPRKWNVIPKLIVVGQWDCGILLSYPPGLTLSLPGSSSGKVLGYRLGGPGSIPGVGEVEIFLHTFVSRLVLGSTQPPIKWVPRAFPGIKAVERRTSTLLLCSAMAICGPLHPSPPWTACKGINLPLPPTIFTNHTELNDRVQLNLEVLNVIYRMSHARGHKKFKITGGSMELYK